MSLTVGALSEGAGSVGAGLPSVHDSTAGVQIAVRAAGLRLLAAALLRARESGG